MERPMQASVILSAAKNLLFLLIYKQILRCAQDDKQICCSGMTR
ncbi:MAG: hypothetical protein ACRD1I_04090 [Terriglobia bacterium]